MLNIGSFKPLSELCSIISSGGTPSRKMPHYFDKNGHLWVKSKELLFKGIDDTEEKISDEGLKKSSAKYYPSGTILVAMYGANVGQLAWLKKPATVNQAICALVVDEQKADNMFVYYSLLHTREKLIVQAQGAAQQNLNAGQIKSFEIPYIDLENQQKIASILSSYDDLIENNNRRIAILEEMARSLYREWFIKFRFPGHEEVKMVDSELGQIPEGWEAKHLENVIDINRGRSYKSSELVEEGGLPFLNLKNIARDGGFRRDGLKWYNGPYKPAQTACANDIIMAVTDMTQERAVIARPARVPNMGLDIFVLSMDLIKITAKPDYDNGFVYCLLRYSQFSDEVKQFANGANVLHLSPTVIEQYRAIIPPMELQTKFYTIVQGLHRLQDNLAIKNDNLKTQRDMLLPKLISGKIEVSK